MIFRTKMDEVTADWMTFMIVVLTKHYSCDQIKRNEMSWVCSMYWGRGEVQAGFWCENLRERERETTWKC
jgi:hypothetical protein